MWLGEEELLIQQKTGLRERSGFVEPKRHPDQKQFDIFARDYDKRFIETYRPVYEIFSGQLVKILKTLGTPLRVLDVGCGNGWTAEQVAQESSGVYVGIDPSEASLKVLKERMTPRKNLRVSSFRYSAEWLCKEEVFTAVSESLGGKPHLVICNTAFHQIRKTFPGIKSLFLSLYGLQTFDGVALFGDYYYPKNLAESEIQKTLQWIKKRTGQNPTTPEGWFQPNEIRLMLKETGYKIEETFETEANPEICLKYYLMKCAIKSLRL